MDVCKAHTGAGWVGQSYECSTQGFRESGNVDNGFGVKNGYYSNINDVENGNNNGFRNILDGFEKERETNLIETRSEKSHIKCYVGDHTHTSSKVKDSHNDNDDDKYNGSVGDHVNSAYNDNKVKSYINSANNGSNIGYDYANKKMFDNDNSVRSSNNDKNSVEKKYLEEQKDIMRNKYNKFNKTVLSNSKIVSKVFDISTENFFIFTVFEPTWTYLSLIQKTKRGKNRSTAHRSYWYSSLAITVFEIENEILTENGIFYNSNNNHNIKNNSKNDNNNNNDNKRKYMRLGEYVACSCHGSVRDSPPLELQLPPGQPHSFIH